MKYDIVIFGSGIMGAVTAFILERRGYSVLMLEKSDGVFGGEQTLASQGILHSGFKYLCSRRNIAIFDESLRWWKIILDSFSEDAVLSNKISVVGEDTISKYKVWLASKLFKGNAPVFYNKGTCIVSEKVLSPEILMRNLLKETNIMRYDYNSLIKLGNCVRFKSGKEDVSIIAKHFVCAAGIGNRNLFNLIARHDVNQLEKIFKMFTIKDNFYLPKVFSHYITYNSHFSPMFTIISKMKELYVGGNISKTDISINSFIDKLEFLKDFSESFLTYDDISYKYTRVVDGTTPYVSTVGNCTIVYPGKMVLAPYAALIVVDNIENE